VCTDSVDPDILGQVGKGISRTYPFFSALFVFNMVDWFFTGMDGWQHPEPDSPVEPYTNWTYTGPSVLVSTDW